MCGAEQWNLIFSFLSKRIAVFIQTNQSPAQITLPIKETSVYSYYVLFIYLSIYLSYFYAYKEKL